MTTGQLMFHDDSTDTVSSSIQVRNAGYLDSPAVPDGYYVPSFGTADLVQIASEANASGLKIVDVDVIDGNGRKLDSAIAAILGTTLRSTLNSGDDLATFEALDSTPHGAQISSLTLRAKDKSQAELTREGYVRYSSKTTLDAVLAGMKSYFRQNG